MSISLELKHLSDSLEGLFFMTTFIKHSMPQMLVYRILPTAVALPKTNQDIVTLVRFAEKHKISLIQELQVPHWQDKQWETVLLWMFQNH
jgi:hypothetical protein